MTEFRVGDRVRGFCGDGTQEGIIIEIFKSHVLRVKTKAGIICLLHTKQCRKLVKKEQQRLWIKTNEVGLECVSYLSFEPNKIRDDSWTEFVEVRKKK
jgi:hypothetical protein